MAVSPNVVNRTKKYEGSINHMYLDNNGFVTVGVGNKLDNASTAIPLNFVYKSNNQIASNVEKQQDWQTIHGQQVGFPASHYDQFAILKLPQPDIDSLLMQRLNSFESDLRNIFPAYNSFPTEAQEGLMDMIYTLGRAGLLGFAKLISAAQNQDWFLAATESKRNGIPSLRNDEIKGLFETAGQKSKTLEGNWIGAAMSTGGASVQITIVFTKIGSNAFSGTISGTNPEDGSFFSETLKNIQLDAARNISFVGPDNELFRGQINTAFTQMTGTLFDGSQIDGTFSLGKQ